MFITLDPRNSFEPAEVFVFNCYLECVFNDITILLFLKTNWKIYFHYLLTALQTFSPLFCWKSVYKYWEINTRYFWMCGCCCHCFGKQMNITPTKGNASLRNEDKRRNQFQGKWTQAYSNLVWWILTNNDYNLGIKTLHLPIEQTAEVHDSWICCVNVYHWMRGRLVKWGTRLKTKSPWILVSLKSLFRPKTS